MSARQLTFCWRSGKLAASGLWLSQAESAAFPRVGWGVADHEDLVPAPSPVTRCPRIMQGYLELEEMKTFIRATQKVLGETV